MNRCRCVLLAVANLLLICNSVHSLNFSNAILTQSFVQNLLTVHVCRHITDLISIIKHCNDANVRVVMNKLNDTLLPDIHHLLDVSCFNDSALQLKITSYNKWIPVDLNNSSGMLGHLPNGAGCKNEQILQLITLTSWKNGSSIDFRPPLVNDLKGNSAPNNDFKFDKELFVKSGFKILEIVNGIGEMLSSHVRDIHNNVTPDIFWSIAPMRPEGLNTLDYLLPIAPLRTKILFKNVGFRQTKNYFLKPFSTTSWCALGFCALLVVVFTILTFWVEKNVLSLTTSSASDSFLQAIAAVTQQGLVMAPVVTAERVIMLNLLILSLLVYNYYTSSVVAGLLNQPPKSFTKLHDLSHMKLVVGVENNPYIASVLNTTDDTDLKHFYDLKVSPHNKARLFQSGCSGISRIKSGDFAFITNPDVLYPLVAKTYSEAQICELMEIDLFSELLYVTIQKRNQFKKLLTISYRRLVENGLLNRQKVLFLPTKPKCTSNSFLQMIGLEQALPAFVFFYLGTTAAALVFIVEKLHSHLWRTFQHQVIEKIQIFNTC